MAIVRIYTGNDGKSHFQDVPPQLRATSGGWPLDAEAMVYPEAGLLLRRFDPQRSNPWHPAPGRVCVFTVSGAVEIEVGDGTKRRIGPGDILIAEDVTGQGHYTREVGGEPRVSLFVPMAMHAT
ncbi:MAG: cupin domain-containing protein [Chloroflexi bacterium]|nr:cupin domain-containing protein [Chloroflexota bacterium]